MIADVDFYGEPGTQNFLSVERHGFQKPGYLQKRGPHGSMEESRVHNGSLSISIRVYGFFRRVASSCLFEALLKVEFGGTLVLELPEALLKLRGKSLKAKLSSSIPNPKPFTSLSPKP